MCEQRPLSTCCVCGNRADVVLMVKVPEGLHQFAYCSKHALEEMARTSMMQDTADLN